MVILFDGVCNLCNGAVNYIIEHDTKSVFKFASLQSTFGQNFLKQNNKNTLDFDSIILVAGEKYFIKSAAFCQIMKQLPFPFYFLSYLSVFPLFFSDKVYDFVAKNRYKWFGEKDTCMIPTKELLSRFIE